MDNLVRNVDQILKNFNKCDVETEHINAVAKIGTNIDLSINDFLDDKEKNLNMLQHYSNKCDTELNKLEDYQSSLHSKFTEVADRATKNFEDLITKEQQKDKIFNQYFAHQGFKEDQVLRDHNTTRELKLEKAKVESKLGLYESFTNSVFLENDREQTGLVLFGSENNDQLVTKKSLEEYLKKGEIEKLWKLRERLE
jgi:formyltetrahydrofolate synthetase